MKTWFLDILRRIFGTKQIIDQLQNISQRSQLTASGNGLELLPGTEYSKFAIPLDYPPSRCFEPRYGYSTNKIEKISQWFSSYEEEYINFLKYMRTIDVSNIPINLTSGVHLTTAWIGGAICAFDSMALFAMIQKVKPRIYLEIGSGMTTCFARSAIKEAGLDTKIVSIDPEPRGEIDAICDEVIRFGLETCDLSIFDTLESGDILFFDGSHRSFMNSDVTVFFIDVLTRIKPGVVIHIHDILLPWDYPDSFKYWYWNEQYMLAIYFMCGQDAFVPLLPTAWICRSPEFEDCFSLPFVDLGTKEANLSWRGGGSMWFTKRANI